MTVAALSDSADLYGKAMRILRSHFGADGRTEIDFSRPKPALAGTYAGVYDFNISHSGSLGLIAVGDRPTGCDIEILKNRAHAAVIGRFTADERREIACERDFLRNWTAKEAFIKLNGFALATHLKRLEYREGSIWLDGRRQACPVFHIQGRNFTACICGDDKIIETTI